MDPLNKKILPAGTDSFGPQNRPSRAAGWVALLIILIYFIPVAFPLSFLWGTHQVKYLPLAFKGALIVILVVLLTPTVSNKTGSVIERLISTLSSLKTFWKVAFVLLVSGLGAVLFWHFRIALDVYGDAPTIARYQNALSAVDWKSALSFLEIDATARWIHAVLTDVLKRDFVSAYQIVSVFCGALFVLVVLLFVASPNEKLATRAFLAPLILLNGANQLFFGHVENYTILYLLIVVYLLTAIRCLDRGKSVWIPALIFIVAMKVHLMAVVLLPSFLYVITSAGSKKLPMLKRLITWRGVAYAVLASALIGVAIYIWILNSFRADYSQTQPIRWDTILLPVTAPSTMPSNHYTLFSSYHLADVFNLIWYITSGGTILGIALAVMFFKRIPWRKPKFIFIFLSVLYSFVFDFMVNAGLGIPFDWDLLSVASLPLVFLAATALGEIFQRQEESIERNRPVSLVFTCSIFSLIIFAVNASPSLLLQHLEDMTFWSLRGYYYRSTYALLWAHNIMNESKEESETPTRLLGRISPEASSSPDREVFPQAYNMGAFHDSLHHWDKAIEYYKLALRLSPDEPVIIKKLGISYYKLKMYDESLPMLERCEKYLKNDPEVYKYLGALYTTLNVSKAKAIEYWTRFLELQKNDPEAQGIKEILEKLKDKRLK